MASEAITVSQPNPVALVALALEQKADIQTLERLLDLQLKWEANEARKAYVEAMNAFKLDPPKVTKNKHVEFGNTKYDHATLDNVVKTITAGLSKHGLSHNWKVEQTVDRIKVTCVITHSMGHSESVSLESPADSSGSKNSIQAIGSAVTYLQRYTLLAATGMAAEGMDDDAVTVEAGDVSEEVEWIANAKDLPELKKIYEAAYLKAQKAKNRRGMQMLISAKNARKAELEGLA